MKCPIDQCELVHKTYEENVQVDACPDCGGMWLDPRELEQIQETFGHDYSRELAQSPDLGGRAYEMAKAKSRPEVACPKCHLTMERREHGGASQVLIDVCTQCRGVWLDKGELQALEVFYERMNAGAEQTDETFEAIEKGFFASLLHILKRA